MISPSIVVMPWSLCFLRRWTACSGFHFDNFNKQPDSQEVGKEQENVMPELKQGFAYTACLSMDELQAASLIVSTYD